MDPNSRMSLMSSGGISKDSVGKPLIFMVSKNSTNATFIHAITTNGVKVGTYQMPERMQGARGFFRDPYLYVVANYSSTTMRKIDCRTMTLAATIGLPRAFGDMAHMSPISATKFISVSSRGGAYYIFDIATDFFTTYPYTFGPYTDVAQTHGTLTLFDQLASGPANVWSRVWWTAGQASTANVVIGNSTLSGNVLAPGGTQDVIAATNLSRNMGITMSSSKGLIHNFGGIRYRINQSTTRTSITFNSYTIGSSSYSVGNSESYNYKRLVGTNENYLYLIVTGNIFSDHRIAACDPFASTAITPVDLNIGIGPGNGNFPPISVVGYKINEAGYMAIAYWDTGFYGPNTDRYVIQIVNGLTIVNTYTGSVGSSFTSDNQAGSDNACDFFLDSTWSTDLLFSGSNYV